jgi:hypothetical protein
MSNYRHAAGNGRPLYRRRRRQLALDLDALAPIVRCPLCRAPRRLLLSRRGPRFVCQCDDSK